MLVYMPDRGVGDLMWHLPTIRAIAAKEPAGKVVLATRPTTRASALLAVEPAVERVVDLDYRKGAFKRLAETADFYRLCRSLRPRSVWILEKIGRPAQAAFFAGVPERHGFGLGHSSQERWLSRGPKLPKAMRAAHRIDKLAAFEELHGLRVESREPALRVDPRQIEATAARFASHPKPWLILGCGAIDADRRWPLERFAELADALTQAGTIFWLGGGAEEAARFTEATKGLKRPDACVVSCDLPMDAAAALISQAVLFIGNDSGLMNVAASVGMPAVGLYGPTPPLNYSRWLSAVVSSTGAMADISVDAVLAEVSRRLEPARTAHSNVAM
ncbi:MAG: glycosyltransferase family 9 protein [Parcubacteria group bacterium]